MIVGNDISNFQGQPDFDTYGKNSNFVMIKASEGTNFLDPYLQRNKLEARRVGLPIGYYHFARADLNTNAYVEADWFCSQIKDIQEGEILALDFEVKYQDAVLWCKAFLDRVYTNLGVRPLIYLNKSQVRGFDWSPIASNYGLWLACYDNNLITGAWKEISMQQWTNRQVVPGMNGAIDGDYFFGDVAQFKAYGYKKPGVASLSPSASVSASISPSASVSPSSSNSVSPSPTPSNPVPPEVVKFHQLSIVINSQWNWIGINGWYNQLARLRKILNA